MLLFTQYKAALLTLSKHQYPILDLDKLLHFFESSGCGRRSSQLTGNFVINTCSRIKYNII